MAALNFPPAPIGQNTGTQYTGSNGVTYIWDGYKWVGHSPTLAPGSNSISNRGYVVQVDTEGNLVIPVGAIIKDPDGTRYGADTGNFTFDGNTITNNFGMLLSTDRGTLALGTNMEAPGAPTHFHIAFDGSNAYPSSNDLFLGDDYNYVRLDGNGNGVTIGTSDRSMNGGQWHFGVDGSLLPSSQTIPGLSWQSGDAFIQPTLTLGTNADNVAISDTVSDDTNRGNRHIRIVGQKGYGIGSGPSATTGAGGKGTSIDLIGGLGGESPDANAGGEGGTINITGGTGQHGAMGGFVNITGGAATESNAGGSSVTTYGGAVIITGGRATSGLAEGTGIGGNITIAGGTGNLSGGSVQLSTFDVPNTFWNVWNFLPDGRLSLPRGNELREQTWTTSITAASVGSYETTVTFADNVFGSADLGQISISGVDSPAELNGLWNYRAIGPNSVRLFVSDYSQSVLNSTGWAAYTSGGTAVQLTKFELVTGDGTWKFNFDGSTSVPNRIIFSEASRASIEASPSLTLNGTDYSVNIVLTDTLTAPNPSTLLFRFEVDGKLTYPHRAKQSDSNDINCPSGVDTVIFTGASYMATFKLLIKVEGYETTDVDNSWDAQSTEMIIAKSFRNDTVVASAYGVVHTSVDPLATFTARWNATTSRVEVLCRPTSPTYNVQVRTFATEIVNSD